jgi:hypothetical protein
MTPWGFLAVDQGHLDIRFGHERVREGEAAGSRPHDQIVGVNGHDWLRSC